MKKITLIFCFLVSLSGISQTYDFKTDQSIGIWAVSNGATGEIVPAGLKVSWTSGQPKIATTALTVDANSNKYMVITLNSTAQEVVHIKTKSVNTADNLTKHTDNQVIVDGAYAAPRTFFVDLTHANWTGTVDQFDLILRDNSGTGALSTSGNVIIQKIEFITAPGEVGKNEFLFNSGTVNQDDWVPTNGNVSVSSGILTVEPVITGSNKTKISQDNFSIDASTTTHMHLTYKNESAGNNRIRITWNNSGSTEGKDLVINTSSTDYETLTYAVKTDKGTGWTDATASNFDLTLKDTGNGNNTSAGNFLIKSIVFSTSSTPPNIFSRDITTDWATAANWSLNEVPASGSSNPVNDVVTIPVGIDAVIGSTTGAEVTDLTLDAGTLNITGGGSLIVSGTSTGNVTYNRGLTFKAPNADGWHLVSSPVAGEVFDNDYVTNNSIASGTGNNRGVATYSSGWTYLQDNGSISSTSGLGYSMKRSADGTVGFTGTINTADVNGVAVSASATDFVLLGVPYTAYMSSQTFLTANANLDQSQIWVWEQGATGGSYIANTAKADNFILAPGQGFFVKKANTDATVNFAESNQQSNADTFKKSSRTEVKLLVNDGKIERFAKLYYLNDVTKGYDLGYEGETFGGVETNFDLFSHLVEGDEGKNFQVQSLPLSEMESTIIPLGLKVGSDKEITISAEVLNLPSGLKVYLEDRSNNTFTRLDQTNTNYKVSVGSGTIEGRFFLHTRSAALSVDSELLKSVSIYKSNASTLRIVGLSQGKSTVKLYNVLGEQVMNSSFNANGVKELTLPKLATGVYIVQLETKAGKLNKKIVLE